MLLSLLLPAFADHGDSCSDPLLLDVDTSVAGSTVGRPASGAPTCGTSSTSSGTWYELFAPADGELTLSTCGAASFDTKISVFDDDCTTPTCIDGLDDSCGLQTELTVSLQAGQAYRVLVHGFGAAVGTYTLTTVFVPDTLEPPMDCTGRDPLLCELVDDLTEQVNLESDALVVTESSPQQRLRPTRIYDLLEPIHDDALAQGCALIASSGGTYDARAKTWEGSDRNSFFGDVAASGTLDDGTWSGLGLFGSYGDRFGVYRSRKLGGSAGQSAFAMGVYTRRAGSRGVYTALLGQCTSADYADVFESWYGTSFE